LEFDKKAVYVARMTYINPRKLVGLTAFFLLLLLGAGVSYIEGISQDDWDPLWRLAYIASICVAFVVALYDRKNVPEKTWDFNPKRGVLYFALGWVIFPLMIGADALLGTDFSVVRIVMGTFMMSILIGVIGTFTENVGI